MLAAFLLAGATLIAAVQGGTAPKTVVPTPKPAAGSASPASAAFNKVAKDAAAARDAGRIDESIALYQKGIKLRPSWVEGYWSLGTAFYELDKYAEAKDAFARVVRLQPKSVRRSGSRAVRGPAEGLRERGG
jgi:cytochrome c-type biogenesis protein CcmH/NrfG